MVKQLGRSLGSRVRAARERAGLTQEALGATIGKHTDTISLIERGRSLPSLLTTYELAQSLGVPIDDLLPPLADRRSPKRVTIEAEIAELVRDLPDSLIELARDQLALLARKSHSKR